MSHTARLGPGVCTVHKPSHQDFELLRKADTALEKQVSNLSFIRLAVFVLITFLFASAIHRRDDDAIQKTLDNIYSTPGDTDKLILDPISVYLTLTRWDNSNTQLDTLVRSLQNQYAQIFTVKVALLGTDLSFDLRLIIVSFPLWLCLAQIYLSILREKRRLVRLVGYALLTQAASEDVTAVDKLTFDAEEGPYRSYPRLLIDVSFWIVITVLLSLMLWITGMRTTDDGRVFVKLAVIVVVASAFYSAAFSSWVSTRLRENIEVQLGCSVPLDRFGRIWSSVNHSLISLPTRLRPRLTVIASSILILSTLALQTAQLGCERRPETGPGKQSASGSRPVEAQEDLAGKSRPGYQLLNGKADWPPSLLPPLGYPTNDSENFYGRIVYGLAVFLAVVGLVWSAVAAQTWPRWMTLTLRYVCTALSVALLCEFANPWLWQSWWWAFPPAITLVFYLFARLTERNAPLRAGKIYHAMRMAYVPLLLADLMFLASVTLRLPGLVVLFFSVHTMTLGYLSAEPAQSG